MTYEGNTGPADARRPVSTSSRAGWAFLFAAALLGAQYFCVHVMLHSVPPSGDWFSLTALSAAIFLVAVSVVGPPLAFRFLRVGRWGALSLATIGLELLVIVQTLDHIPSRYGDSRLWFSAIPVLLGFVLAVPRRAR